MSPRENLPRFVHPVHPPVHTPDCRVVFWVLRWQRLLAWRNTKFIVLYGRTTVVYTVASSSVCIHQCRTLCLARAHHDKKAAIQEQQLGGGAGGVSLLSFQRRPSRHVKSRHVTLADGFIKHFQQINRTGTWYSIERSRCSLFFCSRLVYTWYTGTVYYGGP